MKIVVITTCMIAILLLILAPSVSALQRTIVVDTKLKEKINTTPYFILIKGKENISLKEAIQKIKASLPEKFRNLTEKFLALLLLCSLVGYLITYTVGGTLGYMIDLILYLVTLGKWDFFLATSIALIPSDFFFCIIEVFCSIGMNAFDWPMPDNPGHSLKNAEIKKNLLCNYFPKIC